MKFELALQALREGKKVKLPADESHYSLIKSLVYGDSLKIGFTPEEIMSEDWEIVEDNS